MQCSPLLARCAWLIQLPVSFHRILTSSSTSSSPPPLLLLFLLFLVGSSSKVIQVKIIDDEEYEKNKNFFLELAEPRMVDVSLQKGALLSRLLFGYHLCSFFFLFFVFCFGSCPSYARASFHSPCPNNNTFLCHFDSKRNILKWILLAKLKC